MQGIDQEKVGTIANALKHFQYFVVGESKTCLIQGQLSQFASLSFVKSSLQVVLFEANTGMFVQ